jgi:hypothetical protein
MDYVYIFLTMAVPALAREIVSTLNKSYYREGLMVDCFTLLPPLLTDQVNTPTYINTNQTTITVHTSLLTGRTILYVLKL